MQAIFSVSVGSSVLNKCRLFEKQRFAAMPTDDSNADRICPMSSQRHAYNRHIVLYTLIDLMTGTTGILNVFEQLNCVIHMQKLPQFQKPEGLLQSSGVSLHLLSEIILPGRPKSVSMPVVTRSLQLHQHQVGKQLKSGNMRGS